MLIPSSIAHENSCIIHTVIQLREYLPSAKFALMVGSVFVSAGLVIAAQAVTRPHTSSFTVGTDTTSVYGTVQNADWMKTLQDIQAQNPSSNLPAVPNPNSVQDLLQAATTPNLTETIGRTLFINLANAKSQGLGGDIPTQDALIANATAQINQDRGTPTYASSDLTSTPSSAGSLHTYGNAVMAILLKHPKASVRDTLIAIGYATDTNDQKKLADLGDIGKEYGAMAEDLAKVSVPMTLVPLHLQIVNDFTRVADTYTDMQQVLSDPLRGLSALQLYQSLINETGRVFTTIATGFSKNGILFNTDEPGNAWNLLLSQ